MVNCTGANELGVCGLIEEAGTGMAVFVDVIKLPLGTFILVMAIVLGMGGFIGAIISVIRGSIKRKK